MKLASGNGDKRHALKETKNQLYETPDVAVLALLEVENIPTVVWEPACGPGSIVRVLRTAGRQVYATDLVDYDSPDQDMAGWDFLMEQQLPLGAQAIITNPPFKNAGEFARHALALCPRVYMLMRLAFLEGSTRSDIIDGGKLARVLVFKNRLPLMHRDGWTGNKSTNTMAFAWFIWDAFHFGPTLVRRIEWKKKNEPLQERRVPRKACNLGSGKQRKEQRGGKRTPSEMEGKKPGKIQGATEELFSQEALWDHAG